MYWSCKLWWQLTTFLSTVLLKKKRADNFFDGFSFSASFDPIGRLPLHPFENLIHASIIQLYPVSMTSFLVISAHFQLDNLHISLEFEFELIWEGVPLIYCKQKSKKLSTLNVFRCNKPTFIQTLFVVSIFSRAWKTRSKSLIKSGGYPCQNKVKTVRYNILSSTFLQ